MLDLHELLSLLTTACESPSLIKISLGNYKGEIPGLTKVTVRPVMIKKTRKLSFVYRYQTRDVTKNYELIHVNDQFRYILYRPGFQSVVVHYMDHDLVVSMNKKGVWRTLRQPVEEREKPTLKHDRTKKRLLENKTKPHWQALRLTDPQGKIYKAAQDKWKQINHYIELLGPVLDRLPTDRKLRVVDMGAGKGYLTFALYDYLVDGLNRTADVEGVEYRADLVDLCNGIAMDSGFSGLHFTQGTIQEFKEQGGVDVLIALHACDTATDDAIYKGIVAGASVIVAAPCCHKQVRRELEGQAVQNDLDFMTRYGIFMERHAEMLTDSIRALIMEYFGYRTKVLQFISDQHTPKNIMIIGEKIPVNSQRQQQLLEKLQSIKSYFGLSYHHLEQLVGLNEKQ